jgi:hypothetical protein
LKQSSRFVEDVLVHVWIVGVELVGEVDAFLSEKLLRLDFFRNALKSEIGGLVKQGMLMLLK